jgi:hypothetical protein
MTKLRLANYMVTHFPRARAFISPDWVTESVRWLVQRGTKAQESDRTAVLAAIERATQRGKESTQRYTCIPLLWPVPKNVLRRKFLHKATSSKDESLQRRQT